MAAGMELCTMATLLHPTQAHLTVLPHVSSVCNLFLLFLHFCIPAGSLSSFVLLSLWLHIALPVHSVCLNYPPDAVLWHMLQMGQEGIPQCMCCEQGQDRVIEDTELWKYSLEQSKATIGVRLQMVQGRVASPYFHWAGHKQLRNQAQGRLPFRPFPLVQGTETETQVLLFSTLMLALAEHACSLLNFPPYPGERAQQV